MPRRNINAGERPQQPPLPQIDRTRRINPDAVRQAYPIASDERHADA
jgi:hypothetical protein